MTAGAPEKKFVPYGRQAVDEQDIAAVSDALRRSLITQGPLVADFEQGLRQTLSAPHVSVVSNGTVALELAYSVLGLGGGDEIITTPITFVATASAARSLGADVRFADVDPDTGNISPDSVAEQITDRTRGIVAMHFGGLPADLAGLRKIADRHGLWLVEDAAHALGATYQGNPIGACTLSDATTFSFHPVKHITTGEGGAVAVWDPQLKRRVDRLRHHGVIRNAESFEFPTSAPWYYEVHELGLNGRLSDVQCALGLSQLKKQAGWLKRRRAIDALYRELLTGDLADLVSPQSTKPDRTSAHHLMPVCIDFVRAQTTRSKVMLGMRKNGIGTQVHYVPVNHHPYYRRLYGAPPTQPGVEQFYARELSLPMYPGLTDDDVRRVVNSLSAELLQAKGKK